MKRDFYVYVYLNPLKSGYFKYRKYIFNFEPFYIGKGFANRMYDHLKLKDNSNPFKNNTIKQIYANNMEPIVYKIKENLYEHTALNLERCLIILIGRRNIKKGPLTNLTEGGFGISGYFFTKQQRLKMGQSKKTLFLGKNNPFYGKHHSSKTRKLIGKLHRGRILSSEHRNKVIKTLNHSKGINSTGYGKHGILHPNSQKYLIIDNLNNKYIIEGTIDFTVKNFLKTKNISIDTIRKTFYIPKYIIKRGNAKGWSLSLYED